MPIIRSSSTLDKSSMAPTQALVPMRPFPGGKSRRQPSQSSCTVMRHSPFRWLLPKHSLNIITTSKNIQNNHTSNKLIYIFYFITAYQKKYCKQTIKQLDCPRPASLWTDYKQDCCCRYSQLHSPVSNVSREEHFRPWKGHVRRGEC